MEYAMNNIKMLVLPIAASCGVAALAKSYGIPTNTAVLGMILGLSVAYLVAKARILAIALPGGEAVDMVGDAVARSSSAQGPLGVLASTHGAFSLISPETLAQQDKAASPSRPPTVGDQPSLVEGVRETVASVYENVMEALDPGSEMVGQVTPVGTE